MEAEFTMPEADRDSVVQGLQQILSYIGEDPAREGLLETPERVIRSWEKLYGGYKQDPTELLRKSFSEVSGYSQMIILRDIEFYSMCEHHMLPFFGKAHVAYIPKNKVVGISKLARLVEVFARRLQIQERLTEQIAESLFLAADALGVGVIIEAQHFCMVARGVEKQNSVMTTSALRGAFLDNATTRQEFFNLAFSKCT